MNIPITIMSHDMFTHLVIHYLHRPCANLCTFSGKCIRCRHQNFL